LIVSYSEQAKLDRIKQATCQIVCGDESGTGYLISGNRIVTCWHVVENLAKKHPATVLFVNQKPSTAFVTGDVDRRLDVAVLEWREPVIGMEPLQFARAEDRNTLWLGFGFPALADKQGLPIEGTLDDLATKDKDEVDSLLVAAKKLSAGVGSPPHGFSGTPIVQRGFVVGHLKRIIEDRDFKGHAAFGVAVAARAEDFVALLGERLCEAAPDPPAPPPSIAGENEHVLLSASHDGLQPAHALVEALRKRALNVYFPLLESLPGTTLARGIDTALKKTRVVVALVTPRWLEQKSSEAAKLWQFQQNGGTVIPVLADGGSLPPPWDDILPLDLKGHGPAGPAFERLLCAIDGQPAPFEIVKADIQQPRQQDRAPEPSLATADKLIGMGNPRRALMFLPKDAKDIETRRLRALALSKSGETRAAIDVLEAMGDEASLDGESSGVLGGCYRRLYERTGKERDLARALRAYRAGFRLDKSAYAGINEASILLQMGKRDEARDIAQRVLAGIGSPAASDYWSPATAGEAHLILDEVEQAREAYDRAVRRARGFPQHRAVMRRGARRALTGNGHEPKELDDIFCVPRPVAFVGHGFDFPNQPLRFPERVAPDVGRAIGGILSKAGDVFGFSSATTGGDTIFLQKLFEHENIARVLLPCPVDTFLDQFVVLKDRQYEVRRLNL
jgi:tetratricopeptide (TPR) repeat protein